MGETATPSETERVATRKLAAAIVEAVRDDDSMPLDLQVVSVHGAGEHFRRVDVENLVFALAQEITQLRDEREALVNVYVAAAQLRTFPVPFNDHFELVGAVDECRSVLEGKKVP
jgi:hypothetical protein